MTFGLRHPGTCPRRSRPRRDGHHLAGAPRGAGAAGRAGRGRGPTCRSHADRRRGRGSGRARADGPGRHPAGLPPCRWGGALSQPPRAAAGGTTSCCSGIHALAHAAAIDEGLAWATVIFDPVLLPTASAPPPGMPNLGPANRRGVVDARSGPGARRPAAGRRAGACRARGVGSRSSSAIPLLHLVACSPSIIRVPPDLPRGTHVTGAWLDRSPPAPLSTDRCRASSRTAHRPSS